MQDQLDLDDTSDAGRRRPSIWRLTAETRQTGLQGIAMARRELHRVRGERSGDGRIDTERAA